MAPTRISYTVAQSVDMLRIVKELNALYSTSVPSAVSDDTLNSLMASSHYSHILTLAKEITIDSSNLKAFRRAIIACSAYASALEIYVLLLLVNLKSGLSLHILVEVVFDVMRSTPNQRELPHLKMLLNS